MEFPLLSTDDVVELLDWARVSRPTEEEMFRRMEWRHTQRAANGTNASSRQRRRRKGKIH